jgi:adenosylcobinamide-GDP ribazoletransferase
VALAVTFLTVLPLPVRSDADSRDAPVWFPIVGAAVGGAAGLVRYVADGTFGSLVSSGLAVAALVILTGALHQDGLADCADGLGSRSGRERRLEIMRDSSTGAFGALALMLWVLLVVTSLAGLDRTEALGTLVVAAALGRWAALVHAVSTRPARAGGLGSAFTVGRGAAVVATLVVALVAVLVAGLGPGLLTVAAAAAVALALSAWARHSLGGRTGDTLGAAVTLTELAVCLVLLGLDA